MNKIISKVLVLGVLISAMSSCGKNDAKDRVVDERLESHKYVAGDYLAKCQIEPSPPNLIEVKKLSRDAQVEILVKYLDHFIECGPRQEKLLPIYDQMNQLESYKFSQVYFDMLEDKGLHQDAFDKAVVAAEKGSDAGRLFVTQHYEIQDPEYKNSELREKILNWHRLFFKDHNEATAANANSFYKYAVACLKHGDKQPMKLLNEYLQDFQRQDPTLYVELSYLQDLQLLIDRNLKARND